MLEGPVMWLTQILCMWLVEIAISSNAVPKIEVSHFVNGLYHKCSYGVRCYEDG